jgi:4-coumarate--CoA ligase
MIKYKGFQVAPSELAAVLQWHEMVADAAVTSVYDASQVTELAIAYVSVSPELADKG